MKSGRIPSQTRTRTCSALPFGAAPTSVSASTPLTTTTQRQTYFTTIDSQPATGGRIGEAGKVCRALSDGTGTAPLRVRRGPDENAQADAQATCRLLRSPQHTVEFDGGFPLPLKRGEGQGEGWRRRVERGSGQCRRGFAPSPRPSPPRRGRGRIVRRPRTPLRH